MWVLLSGQCPYLPALSIPTERTKLTNSPPQGPDHRPPRLLHPRLHQRPPQRTQPGRARPGQGRGPAPVPAAAPAVPAAARVPRPAAAALPRPAAAALPRPAAGLPDPVNHDCSESPGADGRGCDGCFSKGLVNCKWGFFGSGNDTWPGLSVSMRASSGLNVGVMSGMRRLLF